MNVRTQQHPRPSSSAPTTDQLRDAVDAGATGSKVAAGDPAAVPLGADDEAAGHPPGAADIRRAAAEETTAGARAEPQQARQVDDSAALSDARYAGESHGRGSMLVVVAIVTLAVIAGTALLAMIGTY